MLWYRFVRLPQAVVRVEIATNPSQRLRSRAGAIPLASEELIAHHVFHTVQAQLNSYGIFPLASEAWITDSHWPATTARYFPFFHSTGAIVLFPRTKHTREENHRVEASPRQHLPTSVPSAGS